MIALLPPPPNRSWFLTKSGDDGGDEDDVEPVELRTHEWNHFCFSFDGPSASARVVVNGEGTNVDGRRYPELADVRLPETMMEE